MSRIRWRREHPGEQIGDGQVFTLRWPALEGSGRRDQVFYYQYKADRARRTLRGIDEQVKKAEQAVAGEDTSEAQPVRPAVGRDENRQPRPGGKGPRSGGTQSSRLPYCGDNFSLTPHKKVKRLKRQDGGIETRQPSIPLPLGR